MSGDTGAWSTMKVARARHHVMEFDARVAMWASAGNVEPIPTIADDRLSFELRLKVTNAPPLSEWALIVGDAIHNLRSALDVFVWSNADLASLTEREQRALMWPVVTDPAIWPSAASTKLKSLPDAVVKAIAECQAFQRPEDQRLHDGLLLLNQLDIQDKHRLALSARTELLHVDSEHAIEFEDDAAAIRNGAPDTTVTPVPPEDGLVLLVHRTKEPIVRVNGKFVLTYRLMLDVGDGEIPIGELIDGLAQNVLQALAHASTAASNGTSQSA